MHIAVTGKIGFIPGALDLAAAQAIGLVQAISDFLLYGKGQLQSHGSHRLDEQFSDSPVDAVSDNALAQGIAVEPGASRAYIVGHQHALASEIIMDMHAAAAKPADDPPLQQGGAFSRRPGVALEAEGLGGSAQPLQVAFVLLPGNVPGMGVANQHQPLILGQIFMPISAVGLLAEAPAPESVSTGIEGMVHDAAGPAQRQGGPNQLTLVRARRGPLRKKQSLPPEVLDCGV